MTRRSMFAAPFVVLALILALSACGSVSDLEPAPGKTLPQKPALAPRPLTAEELLTLPPFARPQRVDELGKRGQQRTADRFDLPPPDGTAAAEATPEPASSSTTGPDNVSDPK